MELNAAFEQIKTFVFDMDGVLTDGGLLIHGDGQWIRRMNIRDGYALQLAVRKGYHVIVISGSDAPPVVERLHKLGLTEVYMRVQDKWALLRKRLDDLKIEPSNVLFMGDDMPDLQAMLQCGVAACPKDAAADVLKMAQYISPVRGGYGCVREIIERILKIQDRWQDEGLIRSI